jgi:hypothetical protein
MGATSRNDTIDRDLSRLSRLIDKEDFESARTLLTEVEAKLGPNDPEVTRARALMTFLESNV